jgi:hypothetical protein
MVRGHMCVAARPERIMCRVDPARHDELVKRPGCTTVVMRGRPYRGVCSSRGGRARTQAAAWGVDRLGAGIQSHA